MLNKNKSLSYMTCILAGIKTIAHIPNTSKIGMKYASQILSIYDIIIAACKVFCGTYNSDGNGILSQPLKLKLDNKKNGCACG